MINRVSIISPASFTGTKVPVVEDDKSAIEQVPLARKFSEHNKHKSVGSLAIISSGAVAGPLVGRGLDALSGSSGTIVKLSQKVSAKTLKLDAFLSKLNLGQKIKNIIDPVKYRIFKANNLEKFSKGFNAGGGLKGAAETAKKVAQQAGNPAGVAVAERTLQTLKEVSNLGITGRLVGKTGIFLKKNLTGSLGVINGIFAAMTVNSVYRANEGERFSTLMEDVLGTWVGSIGGYRLFENILKGLGQFVDPATGQVAAKGVIPTVAKIVNKIPLKGFVFPLMGAMIISTAMQKLSHSLFGKPKREEPQVIDSVDSFQNWLKQTGWTQDEINAVVAAQNENATPVKQ